MGLTIPLKLAADKLVWSKIREGVGGRVKVVVCGGSSLPSFLEDFYEMAGIRFVRVVIDQKQLRDRPGFLFEMKDVGSVLQITYGVRSADKGKEPTEASKAGGNLFHPSRALAWRGALTAVESRMEQMVLEANETIAPSRRNMLRERNPICLVFIILSMHAQSAYLIRFPVNALVLKHVSLW